MSAVDLALHPSRAPRELSQESAHEQKLLDLLRHGHREQVLERIVSNKKEVNMVDDGSTPILVATTRGWGEVVQALVENGANVNVVSELGETPLMRAIKSGKIPPSVIKLLLDNGAVETINVAAKENAFFSKWTALHFACDSEMNPYPVVVALLIAHGANPKAVATNGKTPADMCARSPEFAKALSKGKDYLKSHPLPSFRVASSENEQQGEAPMQLGSDQPMAPDEPHRSSLLKYGRQLLSRTRKSTMSGHDLHRHASEKQQ